LQKELSAPLFESLPEEKANAAIQNYSGIRNISSEDYNILTLQLDILTYLGVNPNIKQSDVLTENHAIQAIIKRGIDDIDMRNEIYAQAIKCIINNEDQYVNCWVNAPNLTFVIEMHCRELGKSYILCK
jgi:hypothetical protein